MLHNVTAAEHIRKTLQANNIFKHFHNYMKNSKLKYWLFSPAQTHFSLQWQQKMFAIEYL